MADSPHAEGTPAGTDPPLAGLRVLELAGLGPAPFAAMLLSDMGAEIIRIDRPGSVRSEGPAALMWSVDRGRRSIAVDLKDEDGREIVLSLVEQADVLLEGFRPGVAERLGLGPDVCLDLNPRLVYARVTGYGQEGPLAGAAGHDINYLAIAGALYNIGRPPEPPVPPLNYIADFGGGGTYAAIGILAALLERGRSGRGQVLDIAMVDGVASLGTMFHGWRARGWWRQERGENLIEGAAPYYNVYPTADGEYVAVGAMEPQFYEELLRTLELDPAEWPQEDRDRWPALRTELADRFARRPRDEWERVFAGRDACVSPVLHLDEAPDHPQIRARQGFREAYGAELPAAAPRFSRSRVGIGREPVDAGDDSRAILRELGISHARIAALVEQGVVGGEIQEI